jgi:DUF971 family protein
VSASALTEIKLLQKQRELHLTFANGEQFALPCQFVRAQSPAADGSQTKCGSRLPVNISAIEPVGNYAVKLIFDDGHNTGIYDWNYLYQIAKIAERDGITASPQV